ncbi:MAG TPA: hypothetical protein PLY40_08105, partial [Bacillota bacterium]|nr:hypothetical protein [Bacillota bacterium]
MNYTRYLEAVRQAYESLKTNKLRSMLTMLGIIMGVFSIVTIIAIGKAAEAFSRSAKIEDTTIGWR